MNIAVKQTNHPKRASAEGFNVKRRTLENDWISAVGHDKGLTLRIDLGETGSALIDIRDADELKVLRRVIEHVIKKMEDN